MRRAHLALLFLAIALPGCGRSTAYWQEQLKSADSSKRLHAVLALRERVNDTAAVPVLVEALKDEDTFIRRDAARALGNFGPRAQEATPVLRTLLHDTEPSVRKAAAQTLKRIASSEI